jgi:branched-chain amino acid transport system permease protein
MQTMISALITGVQLGLTYSLLALGVVVLYKATGVANFAVGGMATFCAFAVYQVTLAGVPLWGALALAVPISGLVGAVIYWLAFRPNDSGGSFNLTIRTVALLLLAGAVTNYLWAEGEPFSFPSAFPAGSVNVGGTRLAYSVLGQASVILVIVALIAWFFLSTRWGLLMRATAADPSAAQFIGVNIRTVTAIAWTGATLLAMVAGVLTAPTSLLSVGMMDTILPFAFTGAVLGGLTSLPGAFVGSLIVGVVSGVAQVYGSSAMAVYAVFGVLLLTLLVRPHGLFGHPAPNRL